MMKPDRRLYEQMASCSASSADACVFVGDGAYRELQGAARGGDDPGAHPRRIRRVGARRNRSAGRAARLLAERGSSPRLKPASAGASWCRWWRRSCRRPAAVPRPPREPRRVFFAEPRAGRRSPPQGPVLGSPRFVLRNVDRRARTRNRFRCPLAVLSHRRARPGRPLLASAAAPGAAPCLLLRRLAVSGFRRSRTLRRPRRARRARARPRPTVARQSSGVVAGFFRPRPPREPRRVLFVAPRRRRSPRPAPPRRSVRPPSVTAPTGSASSVASAVPQRPVRPLPQPPQPLSASAFFARDARRRLLRLSLGCDRRRSRRAVPVGERGVRDSVENALDPHLDLLADELGRPADRDRQPSSLPDAGARIVTPDLDQLQLDRLALR